MSAAEEFEVAVRTLARSDPLIAHNAEELVESLSEAATEFVRRRNVAITLAAGDEALAKALTELAQERTAFEALEALQDAQHLAIAALRKEPDTVIALGRALARAPEARPAVQALARAGGSKLPVLLRATGYARNGRMLNLLRVASAVGVEETALRQAANAVEQADSVRSTLSRFEQELLPHIANKLPPGRQRFARLFARFPDVFGEALTDAAGARVINWRTLWQRKGQLFEELLNLRMPGLLQDANFLRRLGLENIPGLVFIEGWRIRDGAGRLLTDGVIAVLQSDGSLRIVAVLEAKSGAASSRGLALTFDQLSKLPPNELAELTRAAQDELDGLRSAAQLAGQPPPTATLEDMQRALLRSERGGQIALDLERLAPSAGETAVNVLVDGQQAQFVVSRTGTKWVGVVPSDIPTTDLAKQIAGQGLQLIPLELDVTSREITHAAAAF